jgi:hypothetical protein
MQAHTTHKPGEEEEEKEEEEDFEVGGVLRRFWNPQEDFHDSGWNSIRREG